MRVRCSAWRNFTILTLVVVLVTILSGAALDRCSPARSAARRPWAGRWMPGAIVPETRSIVREVDEVLGTLTRAARRRLQHEQDQAVLLRETAAIGQEPDRDRGGAGAALRAFGPECRPAAVDDIVARLTALGRRST